MFIIKICFIIQTICPVFSMYNEECEVISNRRTNYTSTRKHSYTLQDNNFAKLHGESTVILSCDSQCKNEGNQYFEAIQFNLSNTQFCEFNKTVSMITKKNLLKGYDLHIERDKFVPVNKARDWARCFDPHHNFVGKALNILNQFQIYNSIGFTLHTKRERHPLVIFTQTGEVLLLSTWTQTNTNRYLLILFLNQVFNISKDLTELHSHLTIDVLNTFETQKDNKQKYFTTLFKYLKNTDTYNCRYVEVREEERLRKEQAKLEIELLIRKEIELQKQKDLELQRQKEIELKQKEIELQRQKEIRLQKQKALENKQKYIKQQEIQRLKRLVQAEKLKSEHDKRLKTIIICILCISSVLMYVYSYGYCIHFTKQTNSRNRKRDITYNHIQNL